MAEKSYEQRVAEAKTRITEVSAPVAQRMRAGGADAIWLDVREPQEWNLFRIPGAVHVPLGSLDEDTVARAVPRDKPVIIYCARGNRSALAAETLAAMGYDDVSSLAGGIMAWAQSGGEIDDE